MARLLFLEYWLYVTLNLFGYINLIMANETYVFTIDKNEHGEPVITHRVLEGIDGGFGALDTLVLDPTITIEPTQASYTFMECLIAELRKYLTDGQCSSPKQFNVIEFSAANGDSDLQDCLEEFIQLTVNEFQINEEFGNRILSALFTIQGMSWVIGKPEHSDCHEVAILDGSNYPIVKVSEKVATLWPSANHSLSTEPQRRESMSCERWFNFDYLDVHFPIFS